MPTYDIDVLKAPGVGEGSHRLSIGIMPGAAITGIQKAVQRYTIALLTEIGTRLHDEAFGTEFWRDVIRGAAQNRGQLRTAFELASSDAMVALREADTTDMPDNERLVSATLTDFNVDTGGTSVYLNVQLVTAAGDDYTYDIPVDIGRI